MFWSHQETKKEEEEDYEEDDYEEDEYEDEDEESEEEEGEEENAAAKVKSYYDEEDDYEEEATDAEEEKPEADSTMLYSRPDEAEKVPDEEFMFSDEFENHGRVEDDEDEEKGEDPSRDEELDTRLHLAFQLATAKTSGRMDREHFRQALAALGKVFTHEETDTFFREAILNEQDPKYLRPLSNERDARGLLRRSMLVSVSRHHLKEKVLSEKGFKEYYVKYLTRKIDVDEAQEHFRALVEGAAEIALRAARPDATAAAASADDKDGKDHRGVTNKHLEAMADTKHRHINEIFIYARDLRRVMVTLSEKLTDEEADQLIRECRPRPEPRAGDGGLERIYFKQYLAMLRDETL